LILLKPFSKQVVLPIKYSKSIGSGIPEAGRVPGRPRPSESSQVLVEVRCSR